MRLTHLFGISFMGALCIGFALTTCEHSTPLYAAPSYALERLHKGHAYVMDSGLTYEDCADYLRHYPESYRCTLEAAKPL